MSTKNFKSTNSNSFSENYFSAELFSNKRAISSYIIYLKNHKGLSEPTVYKNADISKQNWSNYISGKNIPTRENARRLVIGLQCTLEEAETLLALCGFQFVTDSIGDECIKQCIKEKVFNMVDVYLRIIELKNVA